MRRFSAARFMTFYGKLFWPGQQRFQIWCLYISFFVHIPGYLFQQILEIVIRVQTVQLCCLRYTVNNCTGLCPSDGIYKHPVLFAYAESADAALWGLSSYKDKQVNVVSGHLQWEETTGSRSIRSAGQKQVRSHTALQRQRRQTGWNPMNISVTF